MLDPHVLMIYVSGHVKYTAIDFSPWPLHSSTLYDDREHVSTYKWYEEVCGRGPAGLLPRMILGVWMLAMTQLNEGVVGMRQTK
jgi:hypothetical protein